MTKRFLSSLFCLAILAQVSACKPPAASGARTPGSSIASEAGGGSASDGSSLMVRFTSDESMNIVKDQLDASSVEYLEFRLLSAPNESEPLYRIVLSSRYSANDYKNYFNKLSAHVRSVEIDGIVSIE